MSQPNCNAHRTDSLYGAFAFGTVVLACFSGYFTTNRFYRPEAMVPVTFLLGAIYVALGILSGDQLKGGKRLTFATYYLAQIALLFAMIYLSPVRGFFGIIVLPIVSQSIFDLRPRNALVVVVSLIFVCIGVWWIDFGVKAAFEALLNYSAAFAFTIAFTLVTKQALNAREQSEELRQKLEVANEQLREHAAQVGELATTRERNRVAREIHDGVGHYLTVVKTQLDAATALLPTQPDQAREAVSKAASLAGEALDDVRRSVGALRTDAARPPLPVALQTLVQAAGLPVKVRIEGVPRPLATGVEHALFRAAQEGLTNIRKHAAATEAEVLLDFRQPRRLTLAFTDNGKGSNGDAVTGFGLRGICERVELLGGRVDSGNRAGGGFTLTIELPA